jgi:hypothetical protein
LQEAIKKWDRSYAKTPPHKHQNRTLQNIIAICWRDHQAAKETNDIALHKIVGLTRNDVKTISSAN